MHIEIKCDASPCREGITFIKFIKFIQFITKFNPPPSPPELNLIPPPPQNKIIQNLTWFNRIRDERNTNHQKSEGKSSHVA